jgi:hypothetical protein
MIEDEVSISWRISSWSNGTNCIEVASQRQSVHIRDSRTRDGNTLSFATSAWQEFTEGIQRNSIA